MPVGRITSLVFAGLCWSACRTPPAAENEVKDLAPAANLVNVATAETPDDIPALTCDTGEFFSFMLVPPVPPVANAAIELPRDPVSGLPLNLGLPSDSRNARFDVCVNENADPETAKLMRIVLVGSARLDAAHGFNIVTPPQPVDDAELDKVLFGEAGVTELVVPTKIVEQPDRSLKNLLQIHSWSVGDQVLVSVAKLMQIKNPGEPEGPVVGLSAMVGKLIPGDPVVPEGEALECGTAPAVVRTFKIETATFAAKLCTNFIGTAGTTNYEFLGMTVTDDNPALPADVRGKAFTLEGDAFAQSFAYKKRHHNVCDSFAMHLPHAIYAATNAPFGEAVQGCEAADVVPDAPTRAASDQSPSFYYRVKYGAGAWQQFVEPCGKVYMTDCQAAAPGGH
jgi:hypothetical protein